MKRREPYCSCQRINAVCLPFILSVGVLPAYPPESVGGAIGGAFGHGNQFGNCYFMD